MNFPMNTDQSCTTVRHHPQTSANYNCGNSTAAKTSPLAEALEKLDKEIDVLGAIAEHQEQILGIVLVPSGPSKDAQQPGVQVGIESELVSLLNRKAARLAGIAKHFASISSRAQTG